MTSLLVFNRGIKQHFCCVHRLADRGLHCRRRVKVQAQQLVNLQNVRLRFGEENNQRTILNDVFFALGKGQLHMLVGPNGCGKSTMLRVIGDLVKCDSGTVEVDGPCAFVFQNPDNQIVMPTAAAEVALGTGTQRLSNDQVVEKVRNSLQRVGLWGFAEVSTATLSGGQKQRLAIASALAQGPPDPQVLLLDELTTFLDAEDAQAVLDTVKDVVSTGDSVSAIWVTHRLEELQYADHVTYMEDGCVKQSGSPQQMLNYLRSIGASV